jgi:hypothetical protein
MKKPPKQRFSPGRRVLVGIGMRPGTVKSVAEVPTVMGEFVHDVLMDGEQIAQPVVGCDIHPVPVLDADLRRANLPTPNPESSPNVRPKDISAPYEHGLLVLISHSSKDKALAEALIDLLRSGLGLLPTQIRCSSVDGYRLPAGVNSDDQLRTEIKTVGVLIGLLTANSLVSTYVLFELGARWGAELFMIPLLAGIKPEEMRGPHGVLNALSCETEGQLIQLVEDVGRKLGIAPQSAAAYLSHVRNVIALAESSTMPVPVLKKPRLTLHNRLSTFPIPFPAGAMVYSIYFVNDEERYDNTAHAVAVSLEFQHIDGDKRKSIGLWMVNSQNGQITWTERMSIRMGDDPKCLPLFYWDANILPCTYFLFDAKTMIVNPYGLLVSVKNSAPLQYGQWDLLLKLTGENVEEEWAMTIILKPKGLINCLQTHRNT